MRLRDRMRGTKAALYRNAGLASMLAWVAAGSYFLMEWLYPTTATPVIEAWTIVGIIGFIVACLNLKDAYEDKAAVTASGKNGLLEETARHGVRSEWLRIVKTGLVISLGIVSLNVQSSLTPEIREKLDLPLWTPVSITLTAILLTIVVLITISGILDRTHRKRIYEENKQ